MRAMNYLLATSVAAVALFLSVHEIRAQTDQNSAGQRQGGGRRRGNFDPAQFQQRMMERYRERLEITDDSEWKAIQPLIQKVLDERIAMAGGRRGGFARGGRRGGETNTAASAERPPSTQSNPAAEELQKAIDSKAPAAEIKAALAKYVEDRKSKRTDLEKAQEALRAVLTSRQEAIATLSGLL
jgi:hypothetical protein